MSNDFEALGLYSTLIEHWDGSAWHVVKSLNPGTIVNSLAAVAHVPATSSAWAVGFSQNDNSNSRTLILASCLQKLMKTNAG